MANYVFLLAQEKEIKEIREVENISESIGFAKSIMTLKKIP